MKDLPRRVGFFGAAAVMVGVIIGSGIFNTPPVAAKYFGSPATILLLWVAGGALALVGALTYAELTTRYPRSGGLYVFLHEGFGRAGPPLAFTFGWTYMLITKPFAAAGIMVPGAEHILKLAGYSGDPHFETYKLALTTVLLVFFTAVNIPGVGLGTGLAKTLTSIKFAALFAIVLVALGLHTGHAANFEATPRTGSAVTALSTVLAAILWTYDGWADVGSIAGEVQNPRRSLPRIFIVGTLAVTALYVAVNAVFIWMLPLDEMKDTGTVAPVVADRLMGAVGGTVVTALVVVSTLGSSHASIITGARVTFAQARDGLLFRVLGRIHPRYQTPALALWVQCILSIIAVWTLKQFEDLANGFTFTMWIFYGLAGVALLLIRDKEANTGVHQGDSADQFRCPGYPIIPLLFVLSAAAMTVLSIIGNPWKTIPWFGVLAAGVPMYYLWTSITRRSNP